MKSIYGSLFCVAVACISGASFANSVNQGDSSKAPAFVGLNFWNSAGENLFIMANHEGAGYRKSYTMMLAQHTSGWKLPVGSNLCVYEMWGPGGLDADDRIDYFKVVGHPSYTNNLTITGVVGDTTISGDAPNLMADGSRITKKGDPLDLASLLKDCQNHH